MNIKETIESWKWRIVRVGHTQASFCDSLQVSRAGMSEYLSGKKDPSIKMFNKIESRLKGLEEAANVKS